MKKTPVDYAGEVLKMPIKKLDLKVEKDGLEGLFYQKIIDKFKNYVLIGKPIPRYLINFQLSQARFSKEKIELILTCLEKKNLIIIKNSNVKVLKNEL